MSSLLRFPRRRRSAAPGLAATPPEPPASELQRRRDALAERVAELQFDLGGLAYEMAIRDHFRLDVLLRRAAELQSADAELGEVERLLHMERGEPTDNCPTCGALVGRGAVFCWQCGTALMEQRAAGSSAALPG